MPIQSNVGLLGRELNIASAGQGRLVGVDRKSPRCAKIDANDPEAEWFGSISYGAN
jgi:hypothetical protein